MEEAFKNNHQYKWLHKLPGWCYMALVKPEYAYSYHWLAYPTVTQLAALPKQMCNNSEGAQIVQHMPGFYHVQLDMNHKNPWRIIEATAKGALNWVSIGADTEPAVGSQQWFMNQVTRLMEVVDAQTTLAQARNAYDDGLVRYRVALAILQTIMGSI